MARDAGLDPWRARALEWLLEHDRAALPALLLARRARLPRRAVGRRWDALGRRPIPTLSGLRPAPAAPASRSTRAAGRRPQPALAEGFVDLELRVAIHLAERGLPASLAPGSSRRCCRTSSPEARPVAPDDRLAPRRLGARPAGREARRRGGLARGPRPAAAGAGAREDALKAPGARRARGRWPGRRRRARSARRPRASRSTSRRPAAT